MNTKNNLMENKELSKLVTSIELEHTNPSKGPYEEIISISLTNSLKTVDRINTFFSESIINNTIPIGEYIDAYISKNKTVLNKVNIATRSNKELKIGEGISNLTFYFNENIAPLKLCDVYREYSLTNFYDDFTKYMVANGSRTTNRGQKIIK